MEKDMIVQAHYKDAPENEWFDVLLTEDHRMYRKDTREEITRTDLQFRADEDDTDIIDMEEEWERLKMEDLRWDLHDNALFLAEQARKYREFYAKNE